MTALEAIAQREATVQYDRARRTHERLALVENRAGHPLTARKELLAARRLSRYGPGETLVVRQIDHDDRAREGWRR